MSTDVAATGSTAPPAALAGWAMFDWAGQPFYTLVQTFLFAPYFANVVVADPSQGQAAWGYAAAFAGAIVAIGSPILGAVADSGGRRKPWIALFGLMLVVGLCLLWFATPKLQGPMFFLVLAGYALAFAGAEFAAVFNNAIMPTLVRKDQLGRLSGIAWGLGYAGGLVSLALVAGFIVTDPSSGKTMLGMDPILSLDQASREGDRLVGPLCAAWFILFVIPFFLFVPDNRQVLHGGSESPIRDALKSLWATVRNLPKDDRNILWMLVARMLYADGLAAIFVFGGIYGASVFGWRTFDLGLFGIILAGTGAVGAVIGGLLDDRVGAKTVIVGSIVILLIGFFGILSVDKGSVLFGLPIAEKQPGSGAFSSLGEQVFLAFAILIGLVAAPVQAAGRSLLARLAPPERMTQYFGLFAFSGKATAFLAPLMIALVTTTTGSQRWGIATTALFLIGGLIFMLPVKEPQRA
ncbi:MFS transporter [Hyphomicrobium sp. CS1BSMeth3]|uniref:MFS transporter n=1 Tax=Hyphomicrobium sp. CS1BSMeth3 TaxID=1892844 RepID=UPI000931F9A4|nr:MFS transporter [Hyphomicrobium sp. CS1BSMeth3]